MASKKREEEPGLRNKSLMWDIVQGPLHHQRPLESALMPRLLTGSLIWMEAAARPMAPLELLAAQGPTSSLKSWYKLSRFASVVDRAYGLCVCVC